KLTVILYLALVLGKRQEYINDIKRAFIGPIGLTMGIFIFVAIQPDLGTGLIILMIAVAIMLCSGISRKTFFKLILLGLVMLTIM
ncbi:FtsW/RodA/SpoVE family cell cycle protein, partial [Escherichia coli]|nr:FtsW/RodA/SpoVE family cell cycle protein [Escherichia coli]